MNTLQKYEKYLYFILLIGIIIYFPILFNGFVWDDLTFIINNPQVHQFNLFSLLGDNLFNSGPFYRPIPAIYFALLYSFFGSHAFPYHLFQLVLHLIDTILLFFYFLFFFSDDIAFFLALIFLVHPINVESVAYIGSTQSELYFLPGIVALLIGQKQNLSRNRIIIITVLLLLCIFTKETGILYLLFLLIYRYIFKLNKIKEFVIAGGFIGVIYLIFRIFVGGVTYQMIGYIRLATIPLWQRLYLIPSIFIYYLKTFFFPLQFLVWQTWIVITPTFENFYFPLILSIIFFICLFVIFYYIHKKENKQLLQKSKEINKHSMQLQFGFKQKQFLFFFLWYILGMGLILQFVPLDMTVADRWFYFPIVGLLGMLGLGLQVLSPSVKKHHKVYLYGAIFIICIFSFRTFIRTMDWKDNLTLYSHDLQYEGNSDLLLNAYATELYAHGKVDEACFYINKSVNIYPTALNVNDLSECYLTKKQYDEAISEFTRAISLAKVEKLDKMTQLEGYFNKAQALILDGRQNDAVDFINNAALKEFPGNPLLLQLRTKAESQVNTGQNIFQNTTPDSQPPDEQRIINLINPESK